MIQPLRRGDGANPTKAQPERRKGVETGGVSRGSGGVDTALGLERQGKG